MTKFLGRIIKRENLVTLLLIVTAGLTLFEIPQRLGLDTIQVILIMLGFLALDGLVEKVGYLEGIEKSAERLENMVLPHPNMVTLRKRESLPPLAKTLEDVDSVFVHAMSARFLVSLNIKVIKEALENGTHFRFLLVAPDNPAMQAQALSSPSESQHRFQVRWIEETRDILARLAMNSGRGTLQLRWFRGVPTVSIIGFNMDKKNGWIQIEPHIFRFAPSERPVFNIYSDTGSEWYDSLYKALEDMWHSGTPVPFEDSKLTSVVGQAAGHN